MRNRIAGAVAVLLLLAAGTVAAQEQVSIRGVVEEVAGDASYIMVSGQKILTDAEFLEDSFIEVEDEVEIIAQQTPQGLRAVDYDFIIEDLEGEEE